MPTFPKANFGFICLLSAAFLIAAPASAGVVISTDGTQNMTCSATQVCSPTQPNAVLNIQALENLLGAGNVTVNTGGSLAFDLTVAAGISWTSAHKLTLRAYRNIAIDQPISVAGTGALDLESNRGNADGTLSFGPQGNATFFSLASNLTIVGKSFTLVNSLSGLASAVSSGHGYIALAKSYDATPDGTYAASPVPGVFGYVFDGLGNTISHLTVTDTDTNHAQVGLFADIDPNGIVRHVNLSNANIRGAASSQVGGIAGENDGTLRFDFVSGTVKTGANGYAGGIVGEDGGTVAYSHSSATVKSGGTAFVGGLIGRSTGAVSDSYATGAVTAGGTQSVGGGLIGLMYTGTVANCHATGAVTVQHANSQVGGLIGFASGSQTVRSSYATGAVTGGGGNLGNAGGLVGESSYVYVQDSFATGTVAGSTNSGGLVGYNDTGGIDNSYARGSVSGIASAGGLIGANYGALELSYATGTVSGAASIGGLIGTIYGDPSVHPSDTYWDTTTSGITDKSQGVGNVPNEAGVTGETNFKLKSGLPNGFSATYWGQQAGINNGLPYLLSAPPP